MHFKDVKPQQALSTNSVWRIQSAQDVSIKQVLGNILTILILAQNNQHRGKRRKGEGDVDEHNADFSSPMNSTAGTAFKFGLA